MKGIKDKIYTFIGFILDQMITGLQPISALSENSELSLRQMEAKGFVGYHDFLQLASESPEAYMVAGAISKIKSNEVLKHLEDNKVPADKFVPALRQGLKDFYKNI